MAWKARLKQVEPTNQPTDSFNIEVEYYDTPTGRSFTQSLKLVAGNITSLQDVKDLVAQRRQDLNKLDQAKSFLNNLVDQDF